MPVFKPEYKPGIFFRNGHLHTILAYFLRGTKSLNFIRTKLITLDHDFIELDQLPPLHDKCAILIHGLEGSSKSNYITSLAINLHENGWDIACINLRGCSGRDNNLYAAYHSGITRDVDHVVEHLGRSYNKLALIGFSLGGNIVLKYMGMSGQYPSVHKIKVAAAVSVPCHLSSSSDKLESWQNHVYSRRFIISLKGKLQRKMKLFPGILKTSLFNKIKTIRDFDNVYTGPANGFEDAEDYYTQCSSLYGLANIRIPTLLINAGDDPFLTEKCMPVKEAQESQFLHFYNPDLGGHVGFLPEKKGKPAAHETWIKEFFDLYAGV